MPKLLESTAPNARVARGFSIRAEAGRAEILLYDPIDPWWGISAKQFHEQLKALGKVEQIDVRINSPGGVITEGIAIHSLLARARQSSRVVAYVDGLAASMASVVAMAAHEIVMAAGSYLMIHNPLALAVGEADDMRELADLLDKMKTQLVGIYAARSRRPADEIARWMDDETWFTPAEAIAAGFAERTSEQPALAAVLEPERYLHLPQNLRRSTMSQSPQTPPVGQQPPAAPAAQTPPATTPAPAPQDAATPPAQPVQPPVAPPSAAAQPADYATLKTALVGADAEFLCGQLEARATLPQAQTNWMAEQQRRLAAARQQPAGRSGVEPLGANPAKGAGTAAGGDAIARFDAAVAAKLALGKKRADAVAAVIREDPDLHEEYLDAYNALHKPADKRRR